VDPEERLVRTFCSADSRHPKPEEYCCQMQRSAILQSTTKHSTTGRTIETMYIYNSLCEIEIAHLE